MNLKCLSSWARIARPELFVTVSKKTALRSCFRAGLPTISRPCVYCPMRFFSRSCGARRNGRGGNLRGVRSNGNPKGAEPERRVSRRRVAGERAFDFASAKQQVRTRDLNWLGARAKDDCDAPAFFPPELVIRTTVAPPAPVTHRPGYPRYCRCSDAHQASWLTPPCQTLVRLRQPRSPYGEHIAIQDGPGRRCRGPQQGRPLSRARCAAR